MSRLVTCNFDHLKWNSWLFTLFVALLANCYTVDVILLTWRGIESVPCTFSEIQVSRRYSPKGYRR
jgi:hypothetical protein